MPWVRLLAPIGPPDPKIGPKGGRSPMSLATMLRIHFLQNWHALNDPMAEEILYDSEAMHHLPDIGRDQHPELPLPFGAAKNRFGDPRSCARTRMPKAGL